ncbi:MAG TPA: sugar transferase [Solirubrobacterales bacterium]|nr:sugar transferase [Solirubrobacterales bacterium]
MSIPDATVEAEPRTLIEGAEAAMPETGTAWPRRIRESNRREGARRGWWGEDAAAVNAGSARDSVFRRLLAASDLLAATAAFVLTVVVLGRDALGTWAPLAILLVVPVCKLAGLYDRDEHLLHKTTLDEAPTLLSVAALYTLLAFLAGDALVDGTLGRGQALVLLGTLFVAMVLLRALARRLAARLVDPERCVVIGHAAPAHRLAAKLERCPGANTRVVGRIPLSGSDVSFNELPILGSFEALERLLERHRIDRAVIAPGGEDNDQRLQEAIMTVKRLGVRVSVLPTVFEAVGSAFVYDEVEGATLLGLRRHGLSRSSALAKRGFDLLGALSILAVLSPLMVLIAVAIKLDSRGPVFFRQRRVGQRDEVFEIFKFRTMVDGADAQRAALAHRNEANGGLFKIEDDPRVTRVGRLLRRTSLDELPQLFNVIGGKMSLVGPRPLVVDEDRLIVGLDRYRLLVPPGVTGLWQIFGSARIPLDEMVKIDYLYGANWSLWLDLKILLRTITFALGRRGL